MTSGCLTPLKTRPCEQCGAPAMEVIHAEKQIRKGWYCPLCQHFTRAIFRERVVATENKGEDRATFPVQPRLARVP